MASTGSSEGHGTTKSVRLLLHGVHDDVRIDWSSEPLTDMTQLRVWGPVSDGRARVRFLDPRGPRFREIINLLASVVLIISSFLVPYWDSS